MVKLSNYVAQFLAEQGIHHVFAIAGGASIHLIHSLADTQGIDFVCTQHEQAAAMAADGYARINGLGAAVATSGPGATNLITGICCAYFDSVPVIYITGQVATFRAKGNSGVRQSGFQEVDTVKVVKPVTKYAVRVDRAEMIRLELEKALFIARDGRPGPVVIDIPDDIQRCEVDPDGLVPFPQRQVIGTERYPEVDECIYLMKAARRPVLILGWGIYLAGAADEARAFVEGSGLPLVPTWATLDLLPSSHPQLVGGFGTHGTRYGNFAVQNADLILAMGTRLDTHMAGSPFASFARDAKKIIVDIDPNELKKFATHGMAVHLSIQGDVGKFLREINQRIGDIKLNNLWAWWARIRDWKSRYPICPTSYYGEEDVNPYVFVKTLADACDEDETIVVDTGCAVAWMAQGFEFKKKQRMFHDFNNTAMGYALPAAIGMSFAKGNGRVICVTGDGALQMNIQELATVIRHDLPIKIFLLNNHGYSMIQQTQDQWLDSRYLASTVEGGLAFPDFSKVARAYGLRVFAARTNAGIKEVVAKTLRIRGPTICDVQIPSHHRVIPQVKFGRPIEDSEPLLDREAFLKEMITKPLSISEKSI